MNVHSPIQNIRKNGFEENKNLSVEDEVNTENWKITVLECGYYIFYFMMSLSIWSLASFLILTVF